MRGLPAPYNWFAALGLIVAAMIVVPVFATFI